jgi:hypothetical protein
VADLRPINATTHFKCAFDVESSDPLKLMVYLRKIFRSWVKEKIGDEAASKRLYEPWFFSGNPKVQPQCVLSGNQIRTAIVATDDPANPKAWVMELVHRDSDESARRWSVDIGLVRNDDGVVRFTTVVSHWMIANYIGAYPNPPLFNTPKYLRWLLNDKDLICKRGNSRISNKFESVTHDNVQAIYDQLRDPDRRIPFVFVTKSRQSDQLVLDPVSLYRYLLGNANVFAFFDDSVLAGMNYFLGDVFRCESGTVRCYQSHFDKNRPENARVHRYFTAEEIADDEKFVLKAIANGFARNGDCFYPRDVTQFSDIFTLRRTDQIKRLLSQKGAQSELSEELSLFIEENGRIEKERAEMEVFAQQCMQEKDEAERRLGNANYKIREAEKLERTFHDAKHVQDALKSFNKLPTTLADVLTKISSLFPLRISIAANAFKTAGEHVGAKPFWQKIENITIAWEMCYDLATIAHELMFETDSGDKEQLFNSRSQYELAMTEGKLTKQDSKLQSLRQFEFEGHMWDMMPHLKFSSKPEKLLRIYFAVDNDMKRIIIGHCGSHIDNATTRTLS